MAEHDASDVSIDEETPQRILCPFSLSDHRFYFWTTWRYDSFDIIITDGGVAWEGSATREHIENVLLKDVNMDVADFVRLSKEGLAVEDQTRQKYQYYLRAAGTANNVLSLEWIFPLDPNLPAVKMKGALQLVRKDAKSSKALIVSLIDSVLEEKDSLQKSYQDSSRTSEYLRMQQKSLMANLEKLRSDKELMQAEMISKFVELLNEKKKKIRELKEELKKRPERTRHEPRDGEAPAQAARKPQQTDNPISASLTLGTLSSGQSQPPLASLDLLNASPDKPVIRPSIRKRPRADAPDEESLMDLKQLQSTPKKQKRPVTSEPVALAKASGQTAPQRRPLGQQIEIVDDEGSAPPLKAKPVSVQPALMSPNPSPSYGGSNTNRISSRAPKGQVRTTRSPRGTEDAGALFDQIE